MTKEKKSKLTMGIVGGGQGGSNIYNIFKLSNLCEIKYIVDQNIQAPALKMAREVDIYTSSYIQQTVEDFSVDLIIEATGISSVTEQVNSWKDKDTLVLNSHIALLIFSIMDESRKEIFKDVHQDITDIRDNILSETERVKITLASITDISMKMNMLSFNAGIEASHAGGSAKGFTVIAQEFRNISSQTRDLAEQVNNVTDSIVGLSNDIDKSLEKFEK